MKHSAGNPKSLPSPIRREDSKAIDDFHYERASLLDRVADIRVATVAGNAEATSSDVGIATIPGPPFFDRSRTSYSSLPETIGKTTLIRSASTSAPNSEKQMPTSSTASTVNHQSLPYPTAANSMAGTSPPYSQPQARGRPDESGISQSVIVGLVVGLTALSMSIVVFFFIWRRRQRSVKRLQAHPFSNETTVAPSPFSISKSDILRQYNLNSAEQGQNRGQVAVFGSATLGKLSSSKTKYPSPPVYRR
ncbi:hypothetical protein CPB83DRAFT_855869 [Crepidotus variabilis]|uniref:Uncharacterized protein n=1 Tax=Crepidotus variabilis TaxID=179855 RepID=A0A9P6EEM4_9AGAR|nr:hypothetical protein CPB83DRAFT_855869 [Crepidotus variabilis]